MRIKTIFICLALMLTLIVPQSASADSSKVQLAVGNFMESGSLHVRVSGDANWFGTVGVAQFGEHDFRPTAYFLKSKMYSYKISITNDQGDEAKLILNVSNTWDLGPRTTGCYMEIEHDTLGGKKYIVSYGSSVDEMTTCFARIEVRPN